MKFIKNKNLKTTNANHIGEIKKKVFIKNGLVPQLTNFSSAVFQPDQQVEPHKHDTMFEIFYCTSGKIVFTVDGQECILEAGDCIIINPGEMHSLQNPFSEPAQITYFGIATD